MASQATASWKYAAVTESNVTVLCHLPPSEHVNSTFMVGFAQG